LETEERRYSPEEKYRAVIRVLGGEDAAGVASEFQVSHAHLGAWRETFVSGGMFALKESGRRKKGRPRAKRFWRKVAPWAALLASLAAVVWMVTRYVE
jgi:transposase-like protein